MDRRKGEGKKRKSSNKKKRKPGEENREMQFAETRTDWSPGADFKLRAQKRDMKRDRTQEGPKKS